MLEGFKINCYPLERAIRVSINLPKDYNNNLRYYPVVYVLDGQNAYKNEESYSGECLKLDEKITKLHEADKDCIFVCIAAANDPDRREKEYRETGLANFIADTLHPIIKMRYRINQYVYALGCSKAAFTLINLVQKDLFLGGIFLSPLLDTKIEISSLPDNKLYYLYYGLKEENGKVKESAEKIKNLTSTVKCEFNDNEKHSESAWQKYLSKALSYLIL